MYGRDELKNGETNLKMCMHYWCSMVSCTKYGARCIGCAASNVRPMEYRIRCKFWLQNMSKFRFHSEPVRKLSIAHPIVINWILAWLRMCVSACSLPHRIPSFAAVRVALMNTAAAEAATATHSVSFRPLKCSNVHVNCVVKLLLCIYS